MDALQSLSEVVEGRWFPDASTPRPFLVALMHSSSILVALSSRPFIFFPRVPYGKSQEYTQSIVWILS